MQQMQPLSMTTTSRRCGAGPCVHSNLRICCPDPHSRSLSMPADLDTHGSYTPPKTCPLPPPPGCVFQVWAEKSAKEPRDVGPNLEVSGPMSWSYTLTSLCSDAPWVAVCRGAPSRTTDIRSRELRARALAREPKLRSSRSDVVRMGSCNKSFLADFGPNFADVGQTWSNSGQSWSIPGNIRSNLIEFRTSLVAFGADSVEIGANLVGIGRTPSEFGRIRAEIGRNRTNSASMWSSLDHILSIPGRKWPNGRHLHSSGRVRPEFDRNRPEFGHIRKMSTGLGPICGNGSACIPKNAQALPLNAN